MNIVKEKWNEIIQKMKIEYDIYDVSFKTWILPLKVEDEKESTLFLLAPSIQHIDVINKKYILYLKVCIEEVTGIEYEIKLITEDDAEHVNKEQRENSATNINILDKLEKSNINPKYTFDTFVVGSNNRYAHAASAAVAEAPGLVYNPLFLYGGVGLGKTHLMHSIGRYILEQDSTKKVLYVTSENFTNDLIDAVKSGKSGGISSMEEFKNKYRNVDVLLVDDIQFIIGKESTQEEFFHTFNHLHSLNKQIIISSDKPPKDIKTLEVRLRTRFEMGIIADISSPDYETRMAILRKKIETDNLEKYNISDEVLQYISSNVKSNIRELEGSLNKLIFLHKLKNEKINIMLAAEALKDIINSNENKQITPELILDIVAEHYGVHVQDLKSSKRNSNIVLPRQIAMYLCREMTDTPLKSIGIILGGRDHATISHGIEKIADEIKRDEAFSYVVDIIKKKINPI